jgi:hypothetical protein
MLGCSPLAALARRCLSTGSAARYADLYSFGAGNRAGQTKYLLSAGQAPGNASEQDFRRLRNLRADATRRRSAAQRDQSEISRN